MSSYAQRLATELRNAYESHDRDAHERGLRRLVATMHYTGPVEERGRGNDCAQGEACSCTRLLERETCLKRTAGGC